MGNKEANIDLVFRNGLKDFEVLPPSEVWNNIRPVIRKKQQPFIILRSAAVIAVLLSLSFLTYRWGREISPAIQISVSTLAEESKSPALNTFLPVNARTAERLRSVPLVAQEIPTTDEINSITLSDNIEQVPDDFGFIPQTTGFLPNKIFLFPGTGLSPIPGRSAYNYNFDDYLTDQTTYPSDTEVEKTNKWSIAAMASPTYYPRFNAGDDELAKQIMASEQSQVSYSGGVAFSYKISRKLSIQSGLYYSSVGQEVGGINSFAGFQKYDYTKGDHNFEVLTSSGTIYTNNVDVFLLDRSGDRVLSRYTNDLFDPLKSNLQYLNNSLRQSFSYLEMPVILRYKLLDKALDLNVIGGLSYNLLVRNNVYTTIDGGRYPVGKTEGLNPIMLSSSIGMGMEYSLSEKFSLNLEPTFRYYINPFSVIPGIKIHPYSIGIFSGLTYKF